MTALATWCELDQMIDLQCNATLLGYPVPGVLDSLRRARSQILRAPKTFEDFIALRDGPVQPSELTAMKASWIAQRVVGARSVCSGMKLMQAREERALSPVVNQLCQTVGPAQAVDYQRLARTWSRSKAHFNSKIDAVCVDEAHDVGHVFKAVSYSTLSGLCPACKVGGNYAPLFAPQGRVIANCKMPPRVLNSLHRCSELLGTAFPTVKWKYYTIVVDDGLSWSYQLHDVSDMLDLFQGHECVCVDDHYIGSILDFAEVVREDPDYLSKVPLTPECRSLGDTIAQLPVDRYTRSASHILEIYEAQAQSDELVGVAASELHRKAEHRLEIHYPIDARRHDLEDCVRGGGWARRLPNKHNHYAITHRGVARKLLLEQKYNPMAPTALDSLVDLSIEQLRRWGGSSRLAG